MQVIRISQKELKGLLKQRVDKATEVRNNFFPNIEKII